MIRKFSARTDHEMVLAEESAWPPPGDTSDGFHDPLQPGKHKTAEMIRRDQRRCLVSVVVSRINNVETGLRELPCPALIDRDDIVRDPLHEVRILDQGDHRRRPLRSPSS